MAMVLRFLFIISFYITNSSISQNIVNSYAKVTAFPPCSPCISICNKLIVDDASEFNVGDDVLLIQMKGAEIIWTETTTFGTITNYNSAGYHEELTISNIETTTNEITFSSGISGIYDIAGKVQLVKIFSLSNDYMVPATGITSLAWDGDKGGVLYIRIGGTLSLNGNIDVRGKGFRGAINPNQNFQGFSACGTSLMNDLTTNGYYALDFKNIRFGARKGEGIVEFRNPRYELGIGPLANGGGGGVNHNAGGGGGGNMGKGGRGGYQYINYDSLKCNYLGNGLGGLSIDREGGMRLYLGGGGGAGHENNQHGNSGGDGGGIVIINAARIEGNGNKIITDGFIGRDSAGIDGGPAYDDGAGGGGAGGSIKIECNDFGSTPLVIQSRGGDGGSHANAPSKPGGDHGPGGGGGGGLICFTSASVPSWVTVNSEGGKAGLDANNKPYGAKPGESGLTAFGCSSISVKPPKKLNVNLGPNIELCSPALARLSTGLASGFTFKWYKDQIIQQNDVLPYLDVNSPAVYSVEVSGGSCPSAKDTVVVTNKISETPIDVSFCGTPTPKDVTLRIANTSPHAKYGWFTSQTSTNPVFVGDSLVLVDLNKDTIFYVADTVRTDVTVGPKGLTTDKQWYCCGGNVSNGNDRIFNAFSPFLLKSVDILPALYQGGCGNSSSSRTVKIYLSKNNVKVDSVSQSIICGSRNNISLNFKILPGNNYKLSISGVDFGHFLRSEENNGYSLVNIVDILPNKDGESGVFFDWKINYGNICDRIPVRAKNICPLPLLFTFINATKVNNTFLINWQVSRHSINGVFNVFVSHDGFNFKKYGSSVSSVTKTNYSFPVDDIYSYFYVQYISDTKTEIRSNILSVKSDYIEDSLVYYYIKENIIYLRINEVIEQIRIYDLSGKSLFETQNNGSNYEIVLNHILAKGTYIIATKTVESIIDYKKIIVN